MVTAITMIMTTMTTEPRKPISLRHELKHQINLREDLVLSQRLRKLFERDSHCGTDGSYRVTSLYFDTPYDDALRDKLSGIGKREKDEPLPLVRISSDKDKSRWATVNSQLSKREFTVGQR